MNRFLAKNDKQLGICLRMLYADGFQGVVKTVKNGKEKIEFHISITSDQETFELLEKRYETLIS